MIAFILFLWLSILSTFSFALLNNYLLNLSDILGLIALVLLSIVNVWKNVCDVVVSLFWCSDIIIFNFCLEKFTENISTIGRGDARLILTRITKIRPATIRISTTRISAATSSRGHPCTPKK